MRSYTRLIAAGLVLCFAAAGAAQEPARPRIGVVNYGQIYSTYEKAKDIKKDLDAAIGPLKLDAENAKAAIRDAQAKLANAKSAEEASSARAQLKTEADRLAGLEIKAREEVTIKHQKSLTDLWNEVKGVVAEHATKRDFDVVLAYGDPANASPDNLANINRKMNVMDMGAAVPIFVRPGADITADVLSDLNERYRKSKK
jgi:Skp family chaperone for outer membrane proteins